MKTKKQEILMKLGLILFNKKAYNVYIRIHSFENYVL